MTEQKQTEIFCNLCGESCFPSGVNRFGPWKSEYNHGLIEAKVVGAYHSHHLLDMNQYAFSFCEPCLRKLFMQCKIKPRINDMQFPPVLDGKSPLIEGEEVTWEYDQEVFEYREWEDSGGFQQAYIDKKCNQKKDCPNKAAYTVMLSNHFTEHALCEEHKHTWDKCVNAELVPFICDTLKPFL